MARKPVKTRKAVRKTAAVKLDAARSLWLAGLGAVALTGKQGDELVTRLASETRTLRANGRKAVTAARKKVKSRLDRRLAPLQKAVEANAAKFGHVVEHGVGRGLAVLGVPSKAEIQDLTHRVSSLSRQLRAATR